MNKETIFSGYIKEVGSSYNQNEQNIYFRLINFNNLYFYAEEIATGAIFPICNNRDSGFREYSFTNRVRYYVTFPLEVSDKLFEFKIQEEVLKYSGIELPTIDEINTYLKNAKNSWNIIRNITRMEHKNEYFCGLKTIKEHIAKLQEGQPVIDFDPENTNPKYSRYTPKINLNSVDNLGYDLSTQDNLCNLIGREKEIKRIVKTLGIKEKSAILIGEPGSGKTSIIEKIALDMREGKSEFLEDKTIFYLSPSRLVAGCKYRGEFEDKLNDFIKFCKKHKGRIIVFIDEIHTLYGLGAAEGAVDGMNILKPHLSNGDITIIGATTKTEYEKYMANDPAFLRRFENIEISTPDKQMTIDIMLAYMKDLENKYRIRLELSERKRLEVAELIFKETDGKSIVVADSVTTENPTLAKNIIENAFAEAIYNKNQTVTMNEINISLKEYSNLSLTFMSEFGYDLSESDNLCKLVGREDELIKLKKILGIKGKSAILIGEPGSGKTSIVEKLALDIKNNKNDLLRGKIIFYLNTASLNAGTQYRGDFEKKLNKLINCCKKYKGQIILFIDEIHTLYGLGRSIDSSIDAMNILKPYISNGTLTIIGATTEMEYEKYMANDPAFLRRFERINVSVPDLIMNTNILLSYIEELEEKYHINLSVESSKLYKLAEYIVTITDPKNQRVVGDVKVNNPTVSKTIIEDAFTESLYSGKSEVTTEDICLAILSCDTLSPTFRKTKAEELREKVIGVKAKPVDSHLTLVRTR